MLNITSYSALDLAEIVRKMKSEGRLTDVESKILSGLIAHYVVLQEKIESLQKMVKK